MKKQIEVLFENEIILKNIINSFEKRELMKHLTKRKQVIFSRRSIHRSRIRLKLVSMGGRN